MSSVSMSIGYSLKAPNNSLQLTRLAGRRRARAWRAGVRDNGSGVARAAGQLSSEPLGARAMPAPGKGM
jgi:hypothetical protein